MTHLLIESDANPRVKRWKRLAADAPGFCAARGRFSLKAFISQRSCLSTRT